LLDHGGNRRVREDLAIRQGQDSVAWSERRVVEMKYGQRRAFRLRHEARRNKVWKPRGSKRQASEPRQIGPCQTDGDLPLVPDGRGGEHESGGATGEDNRTGLARCSACAPSG